MKIMWDESVRESRVCRCSVSWAAGYCHIRCKQKGASEMLLTTCPVNSSDL
jgi:hypothetical protein